MKVAVLVDEFPALSETFILNHIIGLKNLGYIVHVFPTHKAIHSASHQLYHEHKLNHNTFFPPAYPSSRFKKTFACLAHCFKSFESFTLLVKCLFTRFNVNYLPKLTVYLRALPFIDKGDYDIVHCHYAPNGNVAIQLQNIGLCNGVIVTHLHGYDIHDKQFVKTISYKYLFKTGKVFIVNSEFTSQGYQKLGGSVSKAVYIPESLDTSLFKPKIRGKEKSNEIFTIISVGRLVEFKGFKYGIFAVKNLLDKGYKNIKYTIVGAGPLHDELETLIDKVQLKENIQLVGGKSQTEILRFLQNSDLFISPGIIAVNGRQENQGLVIQEAQAVGLPVIVSNVGGTKQGLIDGVTGYLVPSQDITEMSSKIELFLNDPELSHRMGRAGRKFVKENFDVSVNDVKIKALYNELVKV